MTTTLQLIGQLVGLELLLISILLTFRHKFVDGIRYPWEVPMTFFVIGSVVIIVVSQVFLEAIVGSIVVASIIYAGLGVLGFLLFHYYWFTFPKLFSI